MGSKLKFSPGDKVILAYPECEAHRAIEDFIGFVEEAYETECTIYKDDPEEGFWVKNSEIELIQKASVVVAIKPVEDAKQHSALDKQVSGNHYKDCGIQPIEYIHANGLSYLEGNVIKYTTRHSKKNGKQDILKAIHYLELILEMEYKGETE
jgi:hypothetical protein